MAVTETDLRTLAGRLLYRHLPEEHRYRDREAAGVEGSAFGDLEAYLHGFGHMLDLIRGTIEQAHADSFAEPVGNGRAIQTWLLPYLADLVGAELISPGPEARRRELENAVLWAKTKGSLEGVDSVADVISDAEAVVVEGWRRVLATPRLTLPPFTGPAAAAGDGDPMGPPAPPPGTPDLRLANRAVADPLGTNPLYRRETPRRDAQGHPMAPLVTFWKPRALRGAPCFPGAHDDTSARTPDLRDPRRGPVGPHPRRTIIHVRPPMGFFEPGLRVAALAGPDPLGLAPSALTQVFGPAQVLEAVGDAMADAPDRILVTGDLTIPAGATVALRDLSMTGLVTVEPGARLILRRTALRAVTLPARADDPALEATDCLFDSILSLGGYARLVYCTVMADVGLERLEASDCIFAGPLDGIDCAATQTCVRFSRLPDPDALTGCLAGGIASNTTEDPNFVSLWFDDPAGCTLRPARFGEAGAGVLDLTAPASIRAGAEDEGEMGAFHHRHHAAEIRALGLKLARFTPFGQEIAIRYDPHMARPPVRAQAI